MLDCSFFFFNDTATTEIYTLSLHDALPICGTNGNVATVPVWPPASVPCATTMSQPASDRKSTRLNSSHTVISYAVFCLKKKKNKKKTTKQSQKTESANADQHERHYKQKLKR